MPVLPAELMELGQSFCFAEPFGRSVLCCRCRSQLVICSHIVQKLTNSIHPIKSTLASIQNTSCCFFSSFSFLTVGGEDTRERCKRGLLRGELVCISWLFPCCSPVVTETHCFPQGNTINPRGITLYIPFLLPYPR